MNNHKYESMVTPDPAPHVPTYNEDKRVGVIDNCTAVNLRSDSSLDSGIIQVIRAGERVVVDTKKSTEEFYKVSVGNTGNGGYVQKDYIRLLNEE